MSKELREIYESDQADRNEDINCNDPETLKQIIVRDKERRKRVQEMLDLGKISEGIDYYHAAMVFQHGESPEDYRRAHELAKKALELGEEKARWLSAASLDRWLLSLGKPQKFGTQFEQKENGEWGLVLPIDPSTTDEERTRDNVPPLSEALQRFKEKYGLS